MDCYWITHGVHLVDESNYCLSRKLITFNTSVEAKIWLAAQ